MGDWTEQLPDSFWRARYDGDRDPCAGPPEGVEHGANCQRFAYEVLRFFGREVPALRSSELWADDQFSERVDEPEPLDLILFAGSADSFGAHIGVHVDERRVLHLCEEVGTPVVWTLDQFASRDRYSVTVGIKRITGQP